MNNRIAKIIFSALALILMSLVAAGCPVPEPIEETRIIVDQRGVEVEVPKEIERVVVLPCPLPLLMYPIIGSDERVIGMTPWAMSMIKRSVLASGRAPGLLQADTHFAKGGHDVNIEELLKLNPCVVFQWGHWADVVGAMEKAGLSVLVLRGFPPAGECPQDLLQDWFRIVGEVFNQEERAAELDRMQREMIATITTRVAEIEQADRPRALLFWRIEDGLIRTIGGCRLFNLWIEGSGGINVTKDLHPWARVNMEQILKMNPEVIILSNDAAITPQDLLDNRIPGQDWRHVDAVINGRVYKSPFGATCWSLMGAEQALMFRWAAQIFSPEAFADLNMNQIIREFYREFFQWELTDAEIRTILHYDMN